MLSPGAWLQSRYHILQQIGGGGMGAVYLAEDNRLAGTWRAIKEMNLAEVPFQDRGWAEAAFRQEAQILSQLSHPGLTRVTDFFNEGGNLYLVMDYVPGQTLEAVLGNAPGGRLPLARALDIVRQLCQVLAYLHAQNPPVIFRDLKPANVMLTTQDQVRLIDFGIARFFKSGQAHDTVSLGTPGYAAPEQWGTRGQSDARSDIYGLGVLLLQLVTGYDPVPQPFPLPRPSQVLPDIPPKIEAVILRATQTNAGARYRSVAEFLQALDAPSKPLPAPPPVPRRSGIWVGLSAAGVLLAILSVAWLVGILNGDRTGLPTSPAPSTSPGAGLGRAEATPELVATPVTLEPAPTSPAPTAPPPTLERPPKKDLPTATATESLSLAEREAALLRILRYRKDNGDVIFAYPVESPPMLDGRLDEWTGQLYEIPHEVFDPEESRSGPTDLYGRFHIGWNADNLYLGVQVTDDVHVQIESGRLLYKGDDVEIQVDRDLLSDFNDSELSSDDGQVGLSAGDFDSLAPEAYIWLPSSREQPGTTIAVAVQQSGDGYTLEAAIPWWVVGGRPTVETAVGFCLNLSDNDVPNTAQQQAMISTAPMRKWGDPTTWGTLILVDWR
jgi:serine/threonine protein kinase